MADATRIHYGSCSRISFQHDIQVLLERNQTHINNNVVYSPLPLHPFYTVNPIETIIKEWAGSING